MTNLSIIIPHFNTPHYLERLLNTIPMTEGIQVIVVDDKSTVRLEELESCKAKFSAQGVQFFTNNGIKGGGDSRNTGIDHAQGKWLLFSDADDYFLNGFYEILQKYFDSDADIIYFPPTSKEEGSGNISVRHLEDARRIKDFDLDNSKENELNLRYRLVVPYSKLIRKEMIDKHNIRYDKVIHSDDVMFSIKTAFCSKKIAVSKDTIYCIMRNDSSLTSNVNKDVYCKRIDIWIKRYLFLKKHLSKNDFRLLDLFGAGRIWEGVETGVGIKVVLQTIIKFKKNRIHIIPRKIFNIQFIRKWLKIHDTVQKGEQSYYHK